MSSVTVYHKTLKEIYELLYKHYGPQRWWPADTPFEIIIGAILTQNTAWENVEKAIANLKPYLKPQTIFKMEERILRELIRPSGFFNMKAKKIKNFLLWFKEKNFSIENLKKMDVLTLRSELLKINGIGKETADSIILYALEKPVFVIDAYTKRMFKRMGIIKSDSYDTIQRIFENSLKKELQLYNEYHALIVRHSKNFCRKIPLCDKCFLKNKCQTSVLK